MQYINEGTEGEGGEAEDEDMAALLDAFGEGGGEGEGDGGQYIQVTEEEKAAIDRLVGMGFDRQMVSPLALWGLCRGQGANLSLPRSSRRTWRATGTRS